MAYELKDGQGSLFKNDRKESDNHPDYKGQIMVGGVQYWLSAWIKEGEKGKWMSMAATAKDAQKAPPAVPRRQNAGGFEDDIPF